MDAEGVEIAVAAAHCLIHLFVEKVVRHCVFAVIAGRGHACIDDQRTGVGSLDGPIGLAQELHVLTWIGAFSPPFTRQVGFIPDLESLDAANCPRLAAVAGSQGARILGESIAVLGRVTCPEAAQVRIQAQPRQNFEAACVGMGDHLVGDRPVVAPASSPFDRLPRKRLFDPVESPIFHKVKVAIADLLAPPDKDLRAIVRAGHGRRGKTTGRCSRLLGGGPCGGGLCGRLYNPLFDCHEFGSAPADRSPVFTQFQPLAILGLAEQAEGFAGIGQPNDGICGAGPAAHVELVDGDARHFFDHRGRLGSRRRLGRFCRRIDSRRGHCRGGGNCRGDDRQRRLGRCRRWIAVAATGSQRPNGGQQKEKRNKPSHLRHLIRPF